MIRCGASRLASCHPTAWLSASRAYRTAFKNNTTETALGLTLLHHNFPHPSNLKAVARGAIRSFSVATSPVIDKDTTSTDEERQILLKHISNNENVPGGVVSILTLNRPQAANSMSRLMIQQLQDALDELEHEQSKSRCVIITSASPRVFSAGADLKERKTMTPEQAQAFVMELRQTMHRVSELPMPVIAAIQGVAVGGGLELALCADLRIASATSRLGLVETSLAIVPGAGGTQRLPRLIGVSKAKELIFTARKITAQEGADCGLVDHVVEEETTTTTAEGNDTTPSTSAVLDKALDLAWQIARNGPVAIRAAKEAIDRGLFAPNFQEALNVEKANYDKVLSTQDRLEGLSAFAEKRTPSYKGE